MTALNLTGSCIPFHGVAGPFSYSHFDAYIKWVEKGFHGDMGYMARTKERGSLQILLPGVRSILAYGFPYPFDRRSALKLPAGEEFKIAHFARGEDYHKSIRRALKPIARALKGTSKIFCDSGRLMEKETAARAGLGFIGKHTLLIRPGHGSAFMLGFILTTAKLDPAPSPSFPGCGRCERCLNVCPTGALTAPYALDARKCISYSTMETIDPGRSPAMRWGYIYGCDLCQAVCPYSAALSASSAEDAVPDLERVPPERLELNKEYVRREHIPLWIGQDGLQFPLNPALTDELRMLAGNQTGRIDFDGTAFHSSGRSLPSSRQAALTAFFRKTQLVRMSQTFRFTLLS
jgi:epoxyqueuosine reductase